MITFFTDVECITKSVLSRELAQGLPKQGRSRKKKGRERRLDVIRMPPPPLLEEAEGEEGKEEGDPAVQTAASRGAAAWKRSGVLAHACSWQRLLPLFPWLPKDHIAGCDCRRMGVPASDASPLAGRRRAVGACTQLTPTQTGVWTLACAELVERFMCTC